MLLLLFEENKKQKTLNVNTSPATRLSRSLTFVSSSASVAVCSTVCLRSSMVSSSMFLSTWSFSTSPRSAVPPASSSWFGGGEEGKTGEEGLGRGEERRSRR